MKAKRINQPGVEGAIALYDARYFSSVLIDEEEARELIEELKQLLDREAPDGRQPEKEGETWLVC